MQFVYNIAIYVYRILIHVSSVFNSKARAFLRGRSGWIDQLSDRLPDDKKILWLHASSLGEFEQGRSILKRIKRSHPNFFILLTFFSPSGYEVRKNFEGADCVAYMPLDTPSNARRFVNIVKPSLAIMVKYDFWLNHLQACFQSGVPVIYISANFRSGQVYFNFAKRLYLPIFRQVKHFFVQNERSRNALVSSGISQATTAGDTRFDRVLEIATEARDIPIIRRFKGEDKLMVLGSTWHSDMAFVAPLVEEYQSQFKFVIAPHQVSKLDIQKIQEQFLDSITFSEAEGLPEQVLDHRVMIIDNVGLLSAIYGYANWAYVGGAFRGALHNILEPAAHGIPVFFGEHPNNHKFNEAEGLVQSGGGITFSSYKELKANFMALMDQPTYQKAANSAREYISYNSGATDLIMEKVKSILL